MDNAFSPLKMKRKKRGTAAVDSVDETAAVTEETSTEPNAAAPLPDHLLAHSSSTNTIIKGLMQQSIDGILLQSGLDVIRLSSTVFLQRFLMDLSELDAATPSVKSTTTITTGNIEKEREILQAMRHLISSNQDYQFLENALDERWEEECVASVGQRKRKSTLLSDVPLGSAAVKKESRRPAKKTPSSKKTSSSTSFMIPGVLDSLDSSAAELPIEKEGPLPTAAQQVVWDQEDYD